MKKKASIIMGLALFILLALSFNHNNSDFLEDSHFTTKENENQTNNFSDQNYIPRNSANYDPGAKYEWWSSNWTYRIPISVNSTHINRTDFSVNIYVNFTEYLNHPDLNGGELDINSIRIVEYEEVSANFAAMHISNGIYSDSRKYVIPSLFIPTKNDFNATTNATGMVWFEMLGFSEANTNRTFMIYFDSTENGIKENDEMNIVWHTKFNKNTDVVGDNQFHLAYGSQYRALGLGGELTIWDLNLQNTMGTPSTKWGNVENYYVMAPGDFDGDGNTELVVCDITDDFAVIDYNQETEQWEEIWDGAYRFRGLHSDPYVRHYNILAYDMDNDGKDEIIATSYYSYTRPETLKIVIYGFNETLDGSQELIIKNNLSTWGAYCSHLSLADLNQDGWMDIITGSIGGESNSWLNKSYYYLSDQMGNYSMYEINFTYPAAADRRLPRYCYSIKAADIDFDGKMEVLYSEYDGRIYIWEWNGTDLEFKANIDTQMGYPYYGVVGEIEDWDQDGRYEILMGTRDSSAPSTIRVYEVVGDNQINTSVNEWENNNIDYNYMIYPIFGDADNDGDIEIASGCYRGLEADYDGKVSLWESDSEITPDWLSPKEGQYIGNYYLYSASMLQIFGDYDSRIARMEPDYQINTPQIKPPDITIQVFDVDKGPIPGLGVILDNETELFSESLYTDSEGKVLFTDLSFGSYELNVSIENQMGNRSVFSGEILINNTRESFVINSSLWKISFIVEDNDGNRLNYGGINLYNETQGDNLNSSENLALDGTCSFYWFEKSSGSNEYNYSIDYFNTFYSPNITRIYENSVTQQGLTSTENLFNGTTQQTDLGSNDYRHIVSYYANGSTENIPGDQTINWANIEISGGTGNIYQVEIYGVDQNKNQFLMNTFADDYGNSFNLEYQLWNNSDPLVGLKLHIYVHNTTQNDGVINVTLQETFVERVKVDLFQRKIILWDENDIPLENAIVHIYNNDTKSLVNLTTNQDGEAFDDNGMFFWYLARDGGVIEGNYTIKIEFFNELRYFKIKDSSDQLNDSKYFSLTSFEEIIYEVQLDTSLFSTDIEIINSDYMDPLNFKDTLNITVNITAQKVGNAPFSIDPDELGISLKNSTSDVVYINTTFKQL
ncbi:MAG: FG-GAP-like repeat-containing protein, partial [Candidatus Helarchaeota archaeon]